MVEGTPKRETQPLRKAQATASAEIPGGNGFWPSGETVDTSEQVSESL